MTRTQLRRTPPRHHLLECMVLEGVHGCLSNLRLDVSDELERFPCWQICSGYSSTTQPGHQSSKLSYRMQWAQPDYQPRLCMMLLLTAWPIHSKHCVCEVRTTVGLKERMQWCACRLFLPCPAWGAHNAVQGRSGFACTQHAQTQAVRDCVRSPMSPRWWLQCYHHRGDMGLLTQSRTACVCAG